MNTNNTGNELSEIILNIDQIVSNMNVKGEFGKQISEAIQEIKRDAIEEMPSDFNNYKVLLFHQDSGGKVEYILSIEQFNFDQYGFTEEQKQILLELVSDHTVMIKYSSTTHQVLTNFPIINVGGDIIEIIFSTDGYSFSWALLVNENTALVEKIKEFLNNGKYIKVFEGNFYDDIPDMMTVNIYSNIYMPIDNEEISFVANFVREAAQENGSEVMLWFGLVDKPSIIFNPNRRKISICHGNILYVVKCKHGLAKMKEMVERYISYFNYTQKEYEDNDTTTYF